MIPFVTTQSPTLLLVGVLPISGVSGSNVRHGVHAMDSLIDKAAGPLPVN